MRNEINEPHHWRSHAPREAKRVPSTQYSVLGTQYPTAAPAKSLAVLPAELVDAAFSDDAMSPPSEGEGHHDAVDDRRQVVQSISTQLAMLEAQRQRLQSLLAEVQGD